MKVSLNRQKVFIGFDDPVKPIFYDSFLLAADIERSLIDDIEKIDFSDIYNADVFIYGLDNSGKSFDEINAIIDKIKNDIPNSKISIISTGEVISKIMFDSSMNLYLLINSPSEYQNLKLNGYDINKIFNDQLNYRNTFSSLYNIDSVMKDHIGSITVCCAIVKGYMDVARDASNMIDFVKEFMGVKNLIFYELPYISVNNYHRDAKDLFNGLPENPDKDTRICAIDGIDGMNVKVVLSIKDKDKLVLSDSNEIIDADVDCI